MCTGPGAVVLGGFGSSRQKIFLELRGEAFCGIGTMFSLALLSVMVAIALKMVLAVAATFWVGRFTGASTEGINSMALQQRWQPPSSRACWVRSRHTRTSAVTAAAGPPATAVGGQQLPAGAWRESGWSATGLVNAS